MGGGTESWAMWDEEVRIGDTFDVWFVELAGRGRQGCIYPRKTNCVDPLLVRLSCLWYKLQPAPAGCMDAYWYNTDGDGMK